MEMGEKCLEKRDFFGYYKNGKRLFRQFVNVHLFKLSHGSGGCPCLRRRELVETGHLQLEGERYTITEKGRRNGKICESSLAFSVRRKCDRNLARVNGVLRRDAQVRAEILPREDSGVTLRLILDDDKGNIMTLDMLTVSEEQAGQLAENFRAQPEKLYESILQTLLENQEE